MNIAYVLIYENERIPAMGMIKVEKNSELENIILEALQKEGRGEDWVDDWIEIDDSDILFDPIHEDLKTPVQIDHFLTFYVQ